MTSQLVIFPEYPSQMSLFPLYTMSLQSLDQTLTARNKPHWSRPIASQISAFKCPSGKKKRRRNKKEREPSPSEQKQEELVPNRWLAAPGSRWDWPVSASKCQGWTGKNWAGTGLGWGRRRVVCGAAGPKLKEKVLRKINYIYTHISYPEPAPSAGFQSQGATSCLSLMHLKNMFDFWVKRAGRCQEEAAPELRAL